MPAVDPLRAHVAMLLDWEDAHVGFDTAVQGLPPKLRGVRPPGFAHSAWEIVEHIRLAQADILAFMRDKAYRAPAWPDDYWPAAAAPPAGKAWDRSLEAYHSDLTALKRLARNPRIDLFATVPNGSGRQTWLRELLLVADHTAHHVAQIVDVRRALGAWR